jgi:hypothetical protein
MLNSDSKIKVIPETGCACIMLLSFFSPVFQFKDFEYMKEHLQEWSIVAPEIFDYDTYTQSFIELKYQTYIYDEAESFGISFVNVDVSAVQDENGCWIPNEVHYQTEHPISNEWKEHISEQLGIAIERQYINE